MTVAATISLLAALLVPQPWEAQTPLPATGLATHYAPGLMEQVAANRLAWEHVQPCSECAGYAAMLRREDLGRRVYVIVNGRAIGPLLVVDCANPRDFSRHVRSGLVVELSYEHAAALRMDGPQRVAVVEAP